MGSCWAKLVVHKNWASNCSKVKHRHWKCAPNSRIFVIYLRRRIWPCWVFVDRTLVQSLIDWKSTEKVARKSKNFKILQFFFIFQYAIRRSPTFSTYPQARGMEFQIGSHSQDETVRNCWKRFECCSSPTHKDSPCWQNEQIGIGSGKGDNINYRCRKMNGFPQPKPHPSCW